MERYLKSRYKIGEKLGENPFSVTYQGSYLGTENAVIVKIYKRGTLSNTLIKSMREKVKVLERLNHPLIAKLVDGDYGWQGFYYVREYVPGKTLAEVLKETGPFSLDEALRLGEEICEALWICHQEGIVHGALNPQNIFLTPEGHIKLADLVIEGEIRESIPQKTQHLFEGADFASPDELSGAPADKRSDIYSLGLLVYLMLTGKRPFNPTGTLKSLESVPKRMKELPPPPSAFNQALPKTIDDILLKALNPDPQLRFATVRDFKDSLHSRNLVLVAQSSDLPPVSYDNSGPAPKKPKEKGPKAKGAPLMSRAIVVLILRLLVIAIISGLVYALVQTIINQ